MRRAVIVLAVLLVNGCSMPAQIEMINNTGQTVEVLLGQGRWVLSSTVLRITPARSRLTRLGRLREPRPAAPGWRL